MVNGLQIVYNKHNNKLLMSPYLVVRLHQNLVVLTQGHKKHNGGDVFKAVNPLPPLRPLTPYIHHPDGKTEVKGEE